MEENGKSLFRFVDYLDTYKQKSLTTIDYCNICLMANMNFYVHGYGAPSYSGKKYKRTRQVPYLDLSRLSAPNSVSTGPDVCEPIVEPPIKKELDVGSIHSLDDLIGIIHKYPMAEDGVEYNVDLRALLRIKDELTELKAMIGMETVKTAIMEQLLYFIQRLHENNKDGILVAADLKHTVIYGPPGTGKTEVAKLIGRMYSKLGILKNGVFKKATRHDMVAGYLGQTALKTKKLIEDCLGGVLFIDEAYSLGNADRMDSYSKECVDTLCESLSDNKNDLMVIVAGYQTELEEQFFAANPGLESRFVWRFFIEAYSPIELCSIFRKKVAEIGWTIIDETEWNVGKWFEEHHTDFKSFGRDMEVLVFYSKIAHSKRVFGKPDVVVRKLSREDVDAGFAIYMKHRKMKEKKLDEKTKRVLESMYI